MIMSEFVVKIEDEIVQVLGKKTIEHYLQEFLAQAILKAAATDILADYENKDITDESWLTAKKNSFINDRNSQYIKVYANI